MKWFTVHGSLRDHPKWTQLTMEQRGAWISLMTIGHGAEPRWRLGSREHVARLLTREGATAADHLVDGLLDARLLDEQDGELWLHDAEDWQRKPSDDPIATRERKRRQRERDNEDQNEGHAASREVTPTDRQTGHTGQVGQVTPTNLNPCPACDSSVNIIEGSQGTFYGCSSYPTCSWKSNGPPPKPPEPFVPDLDSIRAAHGGELPPGMREVA